MWFPENIKVIETATNRYEVIDDIITYWIGDSEQEFIGFKYKCGDNVEMVYIRERDIVSIECDIESAVR